MPVHYRVTISFYSNFVLINGIMASEEFEVIPLAPVRRLERELALLKKQVKVSDEASLFTQVVDIIKTNQHIVDTMAAKQSELISKIGETNERMNKLCSTLDELVDALVAAAEEEINKEEKSEKLDQIVEQNSALINSLNVLAKEMGKLGDRK